MELPKFIAVNLSFSHRLLPFSTDVSISWLNTISLNIHHVLCAHHTKSISSKSYFNFAHLTTIHLLSAVFRISSIFSLPQVSHSLLCCYQKLAVIWPSYYFCAAFDRHQIQNWVNLIQFLFSHFSCKSYSPHTYFAIYNLFKSMLVSIWCSTLLLFCAPCERLHF